MTFHSPRRTFVLVIVDSLCSVFDHRHHFHEPKTTHNLWKLFSLINIESTFPPDPNMQAIQKGIEAVTSAATGTSNSKTTNTPSETQKKESGQEPVSGVQGSGTADKPFDQGNQDG